MGEAIFVSLVAVLLIVDSTAIGKQAGYEGYAILRLTALHNPLFGTTMQKLQSDYDLDVLHIGMRAADVMVPPDQRGDVLSFIEQMGVQFEIVVDNVQRLVERDFRLRMRRKRAISTDVKNCYLDLNEMQSFLENVAENANTADVTLSSMGTSFEGRDMPYVQIGEKRKCKKGDRKPVILIDAGIHAREWISNAMALNIINKLALSADCDKDVKMLLRKFDWVIAPTINPDGYYYTWQSADTRLWRKTRTDRYANDTSCFGVDANRNFGYGFSTETGASSNPCSNVFAGPAPFSEPESQNVRDWLQAFSDRAAMYLSLHAYGQIVLFPPVSEYGVLNYSPANEEALTEVADAFATVMNGTGRITFTGMAYEMLYFASGTSLEYAWGSADIPFSYAIELSPGYDHVHGFINPADQLPDAVDDTWEALKAMVQALSRHTSDKAEDGGGDDVHDKVDDISLN